MRNRIIAIILFVVLSIQGNVSLAMANGITGQDEHIVQNEDSIQNEDTDGTEPIGTSTHLTKSVNYAGDYNYVMNEIGRAHV